MKELVKKLKEKKLFIIIFIVTVISFIIGILLISILSGNNKSLIVKSLNNFFISIKENKLNQSALLYKTLTNNIIINLIIWILGISIIGIPIVISILSFKSLTFGFTISSLIYTYKFNGIIKSIIYIIPNLINLFIIFVLSYYSISFSLMLFNYLFCKKEYNKRIIVNRYLKLLLISLLLLILTAVLESFVIPKLFNLT